MKHIDEEDREILEKYIKLIDRLCGLIIECMEENKVVLLSPYIREMVVEQAKLTSELHNKIKIMLYLDSPKYPRKNDETPKPV